MAFEILIGRGSRDIVLRTEADYVEQANEMVIPELHLNSIMLATIAPTTNRSMHPGLSQAKATNREADQSSKEHAFGSVAQVACAKPLEWDDPVTEVLTLG